jgi:hypothetical protein
VITGGECRQGIAERLADLLQSDGRSVGLATSHFRRVNGHVAENSPKNDRANVEALLMHKSVAVAVCESRPYQAAREGLGCSRCDVVVIAPDLFDRLRPGDKRSEDARQSEVDRSGITAAVRGLSASGILVMSVDDPDAETWAAMHQGPIVWFSLSGSVESVPRCSDSSVICVDGQVRGTMGGSTWTWPLQAQEGPAIQKVPVIAAAMALGVVPHRR